MYGVDVYKPGGQEYYDSLLELIASWGVDYIKVDDICRPYDAVQKGEIETIRKAIDKSGLYWRHGNFLRVWPSSGVGG